MKVDRSSGLSSKKSTKKSTPSASLRVLESKAKESRSPKKSDRTELQNRTSQREVLERKQNVVRNPTAAKPLVEKQSETAKNLSGLGSKIRFGKREDTKAPKAEDKLKEHDLSFEGPEELTGSSVPNRPDFSDMKADEKSESTIAVTDGGTWVKAKSETFTRDGVEYERTTADDGSEWIEYEKDGIQFRDTLNKDGSRRVSLISSEENLSTSREVSLDSDGEVTQDRLQETRFDEATEEQTVKTRTTTPTEDGGTKTEETQQNPDNSESHRILVKNHDGSSTSAITRTSESDKDIESFEKDGYSTLPLPKDDRSPLKTVESEVIALDTDGQETSRSKETTYTQSSSDFRVINGVQGSVLPDGIKTDPEKTEIVREVTVSESKDESGEEVSEVRSSQTLSISGRRESDGKEVGIQVQENISPDGLVASTNYEGFTRKELSRDHAPGPQFLIDDRTYMLPSLYSHDGKPFERGYFPSATQASG